VQARLTIWVTLNFNDHLAQPPNGLIAAFLWHLAGQVLLSSLSLDAGLILGIVWNIVGSLLLECRNTSLCARLSIDARAHTRTLFLVHESRRISRITGATGMSSRARVASHIASVVCRDRRLLGEGRLGLILKVGCRQVWGVVPYIIIGGLVDLGQLLPGWLDFRGSLSSRIAGNIAEENRRIIYYMRG